ncbi:hypothetical protein DMX05_20465 [Pseudomonas soli]|nr:hypothetical protein DMX05_20465 [Pseudomonas soli]
MSMDVAQVFIAANLFQRRGGAELNQSVITQASSFFGVMKFIMDLLMSLLAIFVSASGCLSTVGLLQRLRIIQGGSFVPLKLVGISYKNMSGMRAAI